MTIENFIHILYIYNCNQYVHIANHYSRQFNNLSCDFHKEYYKINNVH